MWLNYEALGSLLPRKDQLWGDPFSSTLASMFMNYDSHNPLVFMKIAIQPHGILYVSDRHGGILLAKESETQKSTQPLCFI